jgi:PAS domain S-box-containing protein
MEIRQNERKKNILVIEDDEGIAKLVTDIINEEGYEVLIALTGKEAIDYIKQQQISLMLLDYKLPDMSSDLLLDKLSKENLSVPPFIVITGTGDERIAVKMMKRGARDYIVKDDNFLNLLSTTLKQVFDILETEEKLAHAEREIKRQERLFKNVFDEALIGLELYDEKGDLVKINKASLEIFGVVGDVVSVQYNLFNDPNLTEDTLLLLRSHQKVRSRGPYDLDKAKASKIYNTTKSGIIYLDLMFSPFILDEENQKIGYLAHIIDITQQHVAEESLKEKFEELEKINQVMVGRELKMIELKEQISKLDSGK